MAKFTHDQKVLFNTALKQYSADKRLELIARGVDGHGGNLSLMEGQVHTRHIKVVVKDLKFNGTPSYIFAVENRMGHGWFKIPETVPLKVRNARKGSGVGNILHNIKNISNSLPKVAAQIQHAPMKLQTAQLNAQSEYNYAEVPAIDPRHVAFGEFNVITKILKSGIFFPIYISGHHGNGKTSMVEQASAKAKRPMIRIQMSRETDEDDLIGGFRLLNGETKYIKGPAVRAMELGCILLIDEIDRGDPAKVMCLQGILEGKPYYVKKTGEVVHPANGFNILVTGNTRGRGSNDGRYAAATILDEAWLERFPITINHEFPSINVERTIITNYLASQDDGTPAQSDLKFVEHLVNWADIIRKTYNENAIDELISTRRLVQIIKTYQIFGNRNRAIALCINRYDDDVKNAFMQLYEKVDPDSNEQPATSPEQQNLASMKERDITAHSADGAVDHGTITATHVISITAEAAGTPASDVIQESTILPPQISMAPLISRE